jgi:hypothetical protein
MNQVLYEEKKSTYNDSGFRTNAVEVLLISWQSSRIDGGKGDFVMRKKVMVDGKWQVDARKAFDPRKHTKAQLIRQAIAVFDELHDNHPNKMLLR